MLGTSVMLLSISSIRCRMASVSVFVKKDGRTSTLLPRLGAHFSIPVVLFSRVIVLECKIDRIRR